MTANCTGIALNGDETDPSASSDSVSGNDIRGNHVSGNLGHGIWLQRANRNQVRANAVNTSGGPIGFRTLHECSDGSTGTPATYNCSLAGIFLTASSGNTVAGNQVLADGTSDGIRLRGGLGSNDNNVLNNRVFGNEGRGILADLGSVRNLIFGNRVRFNGSLITDPDSKLVVGRSDLGDGNLQNASSPCVSTWRQNIFDTDTNPERLAGDLTGPGPGAGCVQ